MKTARAFISHSSQDKPFVRRLAKDLEERRLNVWIDERELHVGDSIVSGISAGLTDSDYLILVLSRASVASNWVAAELNVALMGQFTSGGVVVLPALIEDCELPILLRDRVYADFRQDYDLGLNAICEVLSQERQPRHTRAGPADGCEEALRYLSAAELRRRLEKRLSRDELRVLWHATLNTDMEDDMRSSKLQICALELILNCQRRELLPTLRSNACLDFPQIAHK